jgi:hypothetical protein
VGQHRGAPSHSAHLLSKAALPLSTAPRPKDIADYRFSEGHGLELDILASLYRSKRESRIKHAPIGQRTFILPAPLVACRVS